MRKLNFYGNKSLLTSNSYKLGIVGSRSILSYTKSNLENLFEEIKNLDFCIVSGGMYGVDLYAHNLALHSNLKTIFVLPQGIKSYLNSALYSQIKFKSNSDYLFVSEYDDLILPRKYTFLERNKVVSEISEVLLVAQASLKSGSISTANHTLRLNKKLLTIPFSLEYAQFQGTNHLLNRGAKVYTSPQSVLESFSIFPDNIEKSIKSLLISSPQSLQNILNEVPINSDYLEKILLKLILEGEIFYDEGNYSI